MADQRHLNATDTINFGSYYTPEKIVDIVYDLVHKNVPNHSEHIFLDTSCGYGNFLRYPNSIGADIDQKAITESKRKPNKVIYHHNSLSNVSRSAYNLKENDKVIIIGNPPYNDKTSIIRNHIKKYEAEIDSDLVHRDLGISFLLSYSKLSPDYIAVLHPLSYLIKKSNFESLKDFKYSYKLMDSVIISSGVFTQTSKSTSFPIIIALYKKDFPGMTYQNILEYEFTTLEGKQYKLADYDRLANYITKYPNKYEKSAVAHFWTMRDINALKRTKTFIESETENSIRVSLQKLPLYCYADIFKDYIPNIPYYFGNSDIMINKEEFEKIKDIFVMESIKKYPFLSHLNQHYKVQNYDKGVLPNYFKNLLGEHYVENY